MLRLERPVQGPERPAKGPERQAKGPERQAKGRERPAMGPEERGLRTAEDLGVDWMLPCSDPRLAGLRFEESEASP